MSFTDPIQQRLQEMERDNPSRDLEADRAHLGERRFSVMAEYALFRDIERVDQQTGYVTHRGDVVGYSVGTDQ